MCAGSRLMMVVIGTRCFFFCVLVIQGQSPDLGDPVINGFSGTTTSSFIYRGPSTHEGQHARHPKTFVRELMEPQKEKAIKREISKLKQRIQVLKDKLSERHEGNDTASSNAKSGTTEDLSQEQIKVRKLQFGLLIGVSSLLIVIGAIIVGVVKKKACEVPILVWQGCGACPLFTIESRDLLRVFNSRANSYRPVDATAEGQQQQPQEQAKPEVPEPPQMSEEECMERYRQQLARDELRSSRRARSKRVRKCIQSVLFFLYVFFCTAIPMSFRKTVSCNGGFFWETHMPFYASFLLSKAVELSLYLFDPSIDGELPAWKFLMLFLPSFLGYSDGYQDSTSIQIAHACASGDEDHVNHDLARTLSMTMFYSFWTGVVGAQWLGIGFLAFFKDPSLALLAKLLHMDALAQCITVKPEDMWKLHAVSAIRTFGEDVPQAGQQTLFVLYVKRNLFMVVSIVFSVGCSLKTMLDALYRASEAAGMTDIARRYVANSGESTIRADPAATEEEVKEELQRRAKQAADDAARDGVREVVAVERNEQIIEVPQIRAVEIIRQVPVIEIAYVDKLVPNGCRPIDKLIEVPVIAVEETVVEVPMVQRQEILRFLPKPSPKLKEDCSVDQAIVVEVENAQKEVIIEEFQYVERVVEVPQILHEERPVFGGADQEILGVEGEEVEILKEVPIREVQRVEKVVNKPVTEYIERIVDYPVFHYVRP